MEGESSKNHVNSIKQDGISDIDPLDATEYGIPQIEKPSLESILAEPLEYLDLGEDLEASEDAANNEQSLVAGNADETASIHSDTASVSSYDVRQQHLRFKSSPARSSRSVRYQRHGSVMRQVALKSVSAQIPSAHERADAGLPTAMCVASLIAVGTSHGLVLVFDSTQVLKWMLGSVVLGKQYGAVSALTFNRDADRLLCGFARGQMTMWNLTDGKLLRNITDAHPPGSAILSVKFTDDHTLAFCADSTGCVFQLEMKRSMAGRTCESRCIFSGARGEACCIEPLHMPPTQHTHRLRAVTLLAIASLSKVLVTTIKPSQKLVFTFPLKGDPCTLPLLAWQFVIIQTSNNERVLDPVLAVARDQTIYFFQVLSSGFDDIRFTQLQRTELAYKLISIKWLNSRTLAAIDVMERAHVIDVRSEEELEVVDVTPAQLLYSSAFYKGLATGGNVSQALAMAGERSCYEATRLYNGQLVLLGRKGVHVLSLRTWSERLSLLTSQKRFEDALRLAASMHDGHAKAVVGLPRAVEARRAVVADKMVSIMCEWADFSMASAHSPVHRSADDHRKLFQSVIPVIVEYCIKLNQRGLLFGSLFDTLSGGGGAVSEAATGVYLESLEPYILSDQLSRVTPAIMQQLVSHYRARGLLHSVEACIVHMDVASLDIHQVFVLCWEHGLYDAIIHVYNKGMMDFTTPLDELMMILSTAVNSKKQLTAEHIKLGNKILVYINCCLTGRAYPVGDLRETQAPKVKEQVFKSLTNLHSRDHPEDELSYPYLRALLHFDCREFFNVLAMSFDELVATPSGLDQKQRLVDVLLYIMVENNIDFTELQVGSLFTFLARQMAKPNNAIMVSRALFEQVLDALCVPCERLDSRHEERQQALLELMAAGGLQHISEDRLIESAQAAKFFQVCEQLYRKRRAFEKILGCYWQDPLRRLLAFDYIQHVLLSADMTQDEKNRVQKEAMDHLQELVEIDARKAARLVCMGFSCLVADIEALLASHTPALYSFLNAVFQVNEKTGSPLYVDRQLKVSNETHEHFIALMCEREPHRVSGYLRPAENYRTEQVLQLVQSAGLTDATAYLLERSGDIHGAYTVLFKKLEFVCSEFSGSAGSCGLADVRLQLGHVMQLCERHGGRLSEQQRQLQWFPLLDTVMALQRRAQGAETQQECKSVMDQVLNNMMSQVSLPAILSKVMQDPSYSGGKFGEVKELLMGMLATYNYEKTLLHTCTRLVNHDLHRHLVGLTRAVNRAIVPLSPLCNLCLTKLHSQGSTQQLICFKCGHSYHSGCLKAKQAPRVIAGEELWLCPLCSKTAQEPAPATRLHRSSSSGGAGGQAGLAEQEEQIKSSQFQSVENLRRNQKTQSRLALLSELSREQQRREQQVYGGVGTSRSDPPSGTLPTAALGTRGTGGGGSARQSIVQHENFALRVAAPRVDFETLEF